MGTRSNAWLLSASIIIALAGCGKKPVSEAPPPVVGGRGDSESGAPTRTDSPAEERRSPSSGAERATLETRIQFEYDHWDLTPEARQTLAAKAAILLANRAVSIRIEGHADERGTDEYNLVLSNKRAVEAKRFLVAQGVDGGRIAVFGFGEEKPLQSGASEGAFAANRRAEFQITAGIP